MRIFKIFEITRTIYSNSERSEQFLVTESFFLRLGILEQLKSKLEKNIGIQKSAGKVTKMFLYPFILFYFSIFFRPAPSFPFLMGSSFLNLPPKL